MSCAATEQHDELCGENSQKHAQRIDRGVADGRLFARTDAVGIGQRGWVGVGSGQHAHDGEIIEFVAQPRQRAHDEDGDDGDEKAGVDIFQSVALHHGVPEAGAGLDAHRGQEEHQPDFAQHHVGRGGGVGDELQPIAKAADEDGDDEWATGDTQFQRHGHARDGQGDAAEEDADDDADEDGANVGRVKPAHTVAHHFGHAVDILFGADHHHAVANLKAVVAAGKKVHALPGDTCDVDAIDAREVHLAQRFSVHRRVGHHNTLADEGLLLGFGVPGRVDFWADKRLNGLCIALGANDEHLVALREDGVARGNGHVAIVQQTRANDIAVEEARNLGQRATRDIFVAHFEHHLVGLGVWIFTFLLGQLLLLALELHTRDIAHGNRSSDDAQHAQRIGAGVTRRNLGHLACRKHVGERFIGRTQARRVGHRTIERTHHHRQVVGIVGVEKQPVARKHHRNVEQNGDRGKHVERDAALAETLEKTGTNLQANAENEKNETEVLHKAQDVRGRSEANVSGDDACK